MTQRPTTKKPLDEFSRLPGVLAVAEFSDDGRLLNYRGQFDQRAAEISAEITATVNMMSKTLSDNFQQLSGIQWTPFHGWTYTGGKYSVCVGGNVGLVVESAHTDYNQIFQALLGETALSGGTGQSPSSQQTAGTAGQRQGGSSTPPPHMAPSDTPRGGQQEYGRTGVQDPRTMGPNNPASQGQRGESREGQVNPTRQPGDEPTRRGQPDPTRERRQQDDTRRQGP